MGAIAYFTGGYSIIMQRTYYLYILECSNHSYYIGYTTDIERRWLEHQQGSDKCKYTRSFPPKKIAQCWQFVTSLSNVLSLEYHLKRLTRAKKTMLIQQPEQLTLILQKHALHAVKIEAII